MKSNEKSFPSWDCVSEQKTNIVHDTKETWNGHAWHLSSNSLGCICIRGPRNAWKKRIDRKIVRCVIQL